MIFLEFNQSGFLRLQAKQISELDPSQYVPIAKGTTINILAYKDEIGLYFRCTFDRTFAGKNTWLVYKPDIALHGTEPDNKPNDVQTVSDVIGSGDLGQAMRFPGFTQTFFTNQSIVPNGNFTWGEATHGGSRIPEDGEVVNGIISIAKALEEVRSRLGNKPVHINSWYRDPATNRAVGGASQSRHMWGDAVDFVVDGLHPYDVYDALNGWWGNRGGLASSSVFTHLDAREYMARWDYGF